MGIVTKLSSKFAGLKAMMAFDNSLQLLVNRLFFRRTSDIYMHKGTSFIVDYAGGDANGTRSCIVSDMYRQYFPALKLGKNISVLDIGANGGGFPLLLHALGFSFNRLVCVEMNPNTFCRLNYNIASNFPDNSTCLNMALSDKDSQIDLILGAGSTGDSIFQDHTKQGSSSGKVYNIKSITLDNLMHNQLSGSVDLVKMDIEGAEYNVLLNPGCEGISRARYLIMEIHKHASISKDVLISRIESLGFEEILSHQKRDADVYCFANKVSLSECSSG